MVKSIRQSGIKKIIVIDGGSEDKTLTILKKFKNIKVVKVNKKGLAFQRMKGVLKSKTKYIALIDADMRPTKNSFKIMLKDIEKSNYAGIEAFIKADKTNSYFDRAYQQIMEVNINKIGPQKYDRYTNFVAPKILKENNFDHSYWTVLTILTFVIEYIKKGIFLEVVKQSLNMFIDQI